MINEQNLKRAINKIKNELLTLEYDNKRNSQEYKDWQNVLNQLNLLMAISEANK